MKKGYYRMYQAAFRTALKMLKYKEQSIISGEGSVGKLPLVLKDRNIDNVLIVTGKIITSLGLLDELIEGLKENDIKYSIFNNVQADPIVENIEEGLKVYESNGCQGIIAFGGGSPMDCAKVIGARATNKNLQVKDLRGYLKVKNPMPPFFAVPTTAGTGSESTIAAVVTDSTNHEKYAIGDPKLMPECAILDPKLTIALPKHVTAATGLDALTHAVEAFIGNDGTEFTDEYALKSIKMIFENLELVYNDGYNIDGRNNMLLASNYAGLAFTRAYVGYVHAIAHALGGLYRIPHGLANAILLPYVLEYYGESACGKLAKIATYVGIKGSSEKELAFNIIERIKELNKKLDIPTVVKELEEKDFDVIVHRALKEANPTYPVPKIMNKEDCVRLLKKLMNKEENLIA
ncbi:iron-containing alcohol dehydrogenase [Clostridium sp. SHJSY1]|uniref:iron-containing alcohol dehydrogenase n=1 Tax=Clostridium sp. SHJSY1 TaxID=2942483 RepID=UPI00287B7DEF|nr:iron-containing alcohol dehydrogenase [Clostridium sp. SHJSY1]